VTSNDESRQLEVKVSALELQIRDLQSALKAQEDAFCDLAKNLERMQINFANFLQSNYTPFVIAFNQHGHQAPTTVGYMPTSRPIKVDG